MRTWSFFDAAGRFTGNRISGDERTLQLNAPSSLWVEGAHDKDAYYVTSASVTTLQLSGKYLPEGAAAWSYANVTTIVLVIPIVVPRPPNPAFFSVTSNVLRVDSLPSGATVAVWGDTDPATYAPTSGWWEGEFDTGLYYTKVSAWPHLDITDVRTF